MLAEDPDPESDNDADHDRNYVAGLLSTGRTVIGGRVFGMLLIC